MKPWPEELIRFLERPSPLFAHVAAVKNGAHPFCCRVYGVQADANGLLWISVLTKQWRRLSDYKADGSCLAVLLTSGLDNESYQAKGPFVRCRAFAEDDSALLERQRKLTVDCFPNLAQLLHIDSSDCLVIGMEVHSVYIQTPGPRAGSLLAERRG
ncbi:hypothetical protein FE783_14980 [Paenibacillus mesophilus]|uniref:hypothetical protein n=1 Tax=Paenibacillus mesophilus TaxID=2582849 RepID=UPI00110E8C12|nr:hypothetical protein [Paenibacillus mesophilus]TMV48974.1 hypothetical protein FE783_14980 [Paenibacillus mesophilus]